MSLLPSRDDLLPGATKAASALLDALAEGSIVVVDRGRAEAAIAYLLTTQTRSMVQKTAKAVAGLVDGFAGEVSASMPPGVALKAAAKTVRKAYEVTP